LELPGGLTLSLLLSVIEDIRGKRIRIHATEKLDLTSVCGPWLPGRRSSGCFIHRRIWECSVSSSFFTNLLTWSGPRHNTRCGTVLRAAFVAVSKNVRRPHADRVPDLRRGHGRVPC
jgi:hypothetical protein